VASILLVYGKKPPFHLPGGIYESSINNPPRTTHEIDSVFVYDNSRWGIAPDVLLQAENEKVIFFAETIPNWLAKVLTQV
jgi:hypothetical protein